MKPEHGGNIYAYEAAAGHAPLDFSANINPLGMPETVREAACAALERSVHYPDPQCVGLRGAIAAREDVLPSRVLCGNGAADLIYRFAYAIRPQKALVCAPAFAEYGQALEAAGCGIRTHRLMEADGFCVQEDILDALEGVNAVFLCNPNNPTGQTMELGLLMRVLDACAEKGIYVMLDECFVDFLDEPALHSRVGVLARYPRLVILKAFTKFYAMPGLRLGYALCADAALLSKMESMGPPWSVSTVAQAAGIAALSSREYERNAREMVQGERSFLKQALAQLGLRAMGEANFLLFKAPRGLPGQLRSKGILVRDCANFDSLEDGWVRIAVRTREENTRLLSAISEALNG